MNKIQQVRKSMHHVTILVCSQEFELWPLLTVPVMPQLSGVKNLCIGKDVWHPVCLGDNITKVYSLWLYGWLETLHAEISQVSMVIKVAWGFPHPITFMHRAHVHLHVKYPLLLSDIKQSWHVFTNFNKKSPIWNFRKNHSTAFQLLHVHVDGQIDTHGKANRCSLATFSFECT
jgi:hypothetical protein